ncbi:MAG: hypothetical protein IRZ28_17170 [Steroidobacteraceae bacterium]|nr:hypothetical protein [Steroidobacteraceae bacterium]
MGSDAGAVVGAVQGGEAAEQQQGQQQQAGLDPAQLEQVIAPLVEGQEELRQWIRQQQEQQQQQESEQPAIDLSEFLEPGFEADPEEQARRLQQAIDAHVEQRVEQRVQQIVNPLQEQVGELMTQFETDRLVAELPFLARDPQAGEQMVQSAMQLAEAEGWGREVGTSPGFWRLVALAGIGLKAMEAEREGDAGSDPVTPLEAPGGTGPMGGAGTGMTAEQVLNARPRRGAAVLPL